MTTDTTRASTKGRPRTAVTAEQATKALAALKAGNTTLLNESRALGFSHNGPLRRALRELIGREEYDGLIAQVSGNKKLRKPEA